ncbi:MAG: LysM domain-containing protein, partial [Anaerolineaceae bacterium]
MKFSRPNRLSARCTSVALFALLVSLIFTACLPEPAALSSQEAQALTIEAATLAPVVEGQLVTDPQTGSRPQYNPGELVNYTVQGGDTLPALAVHFNTTVKEIRSANPQISRDATTLEPGAQIQIPIYYQPLWGSAYQILPDSLFVNGPAQVGFDCVSYVENSPGWFRNFRASAGGKELKGGQIIEHIATNYSISPRLLLALLEYQTGAVNYITTPQADDPYPLGFVDEMHQGLYNQLILAANLLNNAYYGWRSGTVTSIEYKDGRLEVLDPWQNAATVALHVYFAKTLPVDRYDAAIGSDGLSVAYARLFGDPWQNASAHIPGNLTQPDFYFPFQAGSTWAYTGGPHTAWGSGEPYAAIDFAP